MFARRAALVALGLALFAFPAAAAEFQRFSPQAFAAAQAAGRPIFIDIRAWWCPVCRAQEPRIREAARDPAFASMIIFELDYDRQRALARSLGAQRQSTLIAFSGTRETGRSVGDTNGQRIAALMRTALPR